MAKHDSDASISEPFAIPDLFITEAVVERNSHALRFVGMVRLPRVSGDTEELRIVVRLTMPIDAVRRLRTQIGLMLREGEEREE